MISKLVTLLLPVIRCHIFPALGNFSGKFPEKYIPEKYFPEKYFPEKLHDYFTAVSPTYLLCD